MERFTKAEWEAKVIKHHKDVFKHTIPADELAYWWYRGNESLRLDKPGFLRFMQAGVNFDQYDLTVDYWVGAVTIGMSRFPFPFYLTPTIPKSPRDYQFYIADDEYSMLFKLMDGDFSRFARGFYDETV